MPLELSTKETGTYLRQSTIVPNIAMKGVRISNISDLTIFGVLEYWIQKLISRNLSCQRVQLAFVILVPHSTSPAGIAHKVRTLAYLKLAIRPPRDLDNHIQN